jgi:hypothetical protein
MGRHKMIRGICRLCSENTDLSFEHVPPKVTFNKNTTFKSVPFDDYIKTQNPLKNPLKGKTKQGGIGYNSFCRKCNSFLGSNYVHAYEKWVKSGYMVLSKNEIVQRNYRINEIEPLKILKHIISMFLAINKEWYLKSYPELAEFVLDTKSKKLPNEYRVFSYLNKDGNVRYMHHTVVGNFKIGKPINCSEIAFPPYGYVITFGFDENINYLTDITGFKNYDFGQIDSLSFDMFQLPTYLPFPLDYRRKDEIEKNIEAGTE